MEDFYSPKAMLNNGNISQIEKVYKVDKIPPQIIIKDENEEEKEKEKEKISDIRSNSKHSQHDSSSAGFDSDGNLYSNQ